MDPASKRRRIEGSPSPVYNLDGDDDNYEPYIPISQRRREKLAKFSSMGVNAERQKAKRIQEEQEEREDALKEEERLREKARKERTLLLEAQEVQRYKAAEGGSPHTLPWHLLELYLQMQRKPKEKRPRKLTKRFWTPYGADANLCQTWSSPRVFSILIL
jgi:hypothetical protein